MSLRKRLLKVQFDLPSGDSVVLDESIQIHCRIMKRALAIQNHATIDVTGLSQSLREQLLSQFTAWDKRKVQANQQAQQWINVTITAGYYAPPLSTSQAFAPSSDSLTSIVFKGQVALVDLVAPPPNVTVRIQAYTRQIDRTTFITNDSPQESMKFSAFVAWAAGKMGFGENFICDTSYNDQLIENPSSMLYVNSSLLIAIQSNFMPDVAAFIDDDFLIVKDRNKIINPSNIIQVDEFIGMPCWNEWGISATVLFDPAIKIAQGISCSSRMNPSIDGQYVMTALTYDLATRATPWYVTIDGAPPA